MHPPPHNQQHYSKSFSEPKPKAVLKIRRRTAAAQDIFIIVYVSCSYILEHLSSHRHCKQDMIAQGDLKLICLMLLNLE